MEIFTDLSEKYVNVLREVQRLPIQNRDNFKQLCNSIKSSSENYKKKTTYTKKFGKFKEWE